MDSDVMRFDTIWETILFKEKLEDAHKTLTKFYDKSSNTIIGHSKPLLVWKETLLKKQKEINEINEADSVAEQALVEKDKEVNHLIDEITNYCENLIRNCSSMLFEIHNEYEEALEDFTNRETRLKLEAREKFDQLIVEKFREWRMDEINKLRKRIQDEVEANSKKRISSYQSMRKQQFQECETIMKLQEEIKDIQIALSRYPLEANQQLRVYDDRLMKQKENLKILQKQLKFAQKGTEGTLSRSTSRKTSKDTQRTKVSEGMKRRQTVYEQIFKSGRKRFEKQETGSSTTAEDGNP